MILRSRTRLGAYLGDPDDDAISYRTASDRYNHRRVFISDEWLETYCWCEQHTVMVPAIEVFGGNTRSCGARRCSRRAVTLTALDTRKGA